MNRRRIALQAACLSVLMLAGLLSAACGGGGGGGGGGGDGGDGGDGGGLMATFNPTGPAGDMRMTAGASSDANFDVRVEVNGINDFSGAAFHISYDPDLIRYIDGDFSTTGSILLGAGTTLFKADKIDTPAVPGTEEIAVSAALQGPVQGVAGNGLLLTLSFKAREATGGTPITFDPAASLEVESCPTAGNVCSISGTGCVTSADCGPGQGTCTNPCSVVPGLNWSGGSLVAN